MIVDVRTYTLPPRKMKAYIALFEQYGLPVQRKHLGDPIGYFVSEVGALNQVVHLWGFESMADMETKRAARNADPAWDDYLARTEGYVSAQEDKIMRPTSFSKIR